MTYFLDLSDYSFCAEFKRLGTKNIGWLDRFHAFEKAVSPEDDIDILWRHCDLSVAQMRGVYECDLCGAPTTVFAERRGKILLLGTSEIRVFSPAGIIYAAPTLIYHYVVAHHYKPPDEFIQALRTGPIPPSNEYFEQLTKLGLEWRAASAQDPNARPFSIEDLRD